MQEMTPANYRLRREMILDRIVCKNQSVQNGWCGGTLHARQAPANINPLTPGSERERERERERDPFPEARSEQEGCNLNLDANISKKWSMEGAEDLIVCKVPLIKENGSFCFNFLFHTNGVKWHP